MIYIIQLILVLILARFYQNTKNSVFIVLIFALLTIVAGFRDVNVGTDSWTYYFGFDRDLKNEDLSLFKNFFNEIGFKYLTLIAQKISSNYASLFILSAGVTYIFALKSIKNNTTDFPISIFVYMCLGLAIYCYNGQRQAIAIAIYSCGIEYLVKGNLKKYVLVVLFGTLFHKSLIIALPFYFIFRMELNSKTILLIIISSILSAFFITNIVAYAGELDSKYAGYIENKATGGYLLTFSYSVMTAFFCYYRRYIFEAKKVFDTYLMMFLSGTLIFVIVVVSGVYIEIARFAAYFQMSAVFIWPMIWQTESFKNSILLKSVFFIGHILFMYVYYTTMSAVYPYVFNTTLF